MVQTGPTARNLVYCTDKKTILFKTHYFHVLTGQLKEKFHTDFKNDAKTFHTISLNLISEVYNFFD